MTPQEKYKEIACAFARFFHFNFGIANTETLFDRWILTEEGKRLTAEEPKEDLEQSAIECLKVIAQSWVKISDNQKLLNDKFDRFEGRLRGDLFRG